MTRCRGVCRSGWTRSLPWPDGSPAWRPRRGPPSGGAWIGAWPGRLAGILTTASSCDLTRALQAKISRARDQLLTFLDHPGRVEVTNNACERALRPAVVQRKVTNGYRAMWAAEGEAAVRTVVDTARLTSGTTVFGTILTTVSA